MEKVESLPLGENLVAKKATIAKKTARSKEALTIYARKNRLRP